MQSQECPGLESKYRAGQPLPRQSHLSQPAQPACLSGPGPAPPASSRVLIPPVRGISTRDEDSGHSSPAGRVLMQPWRRPRRRTGPAGAAHRTTTGLRQYAWAVVRVIAPGLASPHWGRRSQALINARIGLHHRGNTDLHPTCTPWSDCPRLSAHAGDSDARRSCGMRGDARHADDGRICPAGQLPDFWKRLWIRAHLTEHRRTRVCFLRDAGPR